MGLIMSINNQTTSKCFGGKVTAAQATQLAKALNIYLNRDLGPLWGVGGQVVEKSKNQAAWQVNLVDVCDLDGALGYHWTTNGRGDGIPVAYVGVGTARRYKQDPTATAAHEVGEMAVDPSCGLVMPYPGGKSVAKEINDPVQSDHFGYRINRLLMSNFVTPAWYSGQGTRYDFKRVLRAPLTIAAGGYISVYDGTTWAQEFGETIPGEIPRAAASLRHRHRLVGV